MSRAATAAAGLLGDTSERDYSRKLQRFNAFAEPELRRAIASLGIPRLGVQAGSHLLDAGCGTGEALGWLSEAGGENAQVTGVDLSTAHVAAARLRVPRNAVVLQGDLLDRPVAAASQDLVWCANTINHLHDPVGGIRALVALLRPGGHIAIGQSSLLPDMYFAWDSRLERLTNEAVRQYYRERYGLSEHSLSGVRGLLGWLKRADLRGVTVATFLIERTFPLSVADQDYLRETIFRDTWGERLRPYLSKADYSELSALCDPGRPEFALLRPDFHFMQTFTLAVGQV
jgi:SAM-dependent methyltransferase